MDKNHKPDTELKNATNRSPIFPVQPEGSGIDADSTLTITQLEDKISSRATSLNSQALNKSLPSPNIQQADVQSSYQQQPIAASASQDEGKDVSKIKRERIIFPTAGFNQNDAIDDRPDEIFNVTSVSISEQKLTQDPKPTITTQDDQTEIGADKTSRVKGWIESFLYWAVVVQFFLLIASYVWIDKFYQGRDEAALGLIWLFQLSLFLGTLGRLFQFNFVNHITKTPTDSSSLPLNQSQSKLKKISNSLRDKFSPLQLAIFVFVTQLSILVLVVGDALIDIYTPLETRDSTVLQVLGGIFLVSVGIAAPLSLICAYWASYISYTYRNTLSATRLVVTFFLLSSIFWLGGLSYIAQETLQGPASSARAVKGEQRRDNLAAQIENRKKAIKFTPYVPVSSDEFKVIDGKLNNNSDVIIIRMHSVIRNENFNIALASSSNPSGSPCNSDQRENINKTCIEHNFNQDSKILEIRVSESPVITYSYNLDKNTVVSLSSTKDLGVFQTLDLSLEEFKQLIAMFKPIDEEKFREFLSDTVEPERMELTNVYKLKDDTTISRLSEKFTSSIGGHFNSPTNHEEAYRRQVDDPSGLYGYAIEDIAVKSIQYNEEIDVCAMAKREFRSCALVYESPATNFKVYEVPISTVSNGKRTTSPTYRTILPGNVLVEVTYRKGIENNKMPDQLFPYIFENLELQPR